MGEVVETMLANHVRFEREVEFPAPAQKREMETGERTCICFVVEAHNVQK